MTPAFQEKSMLTQRFKCNSAPIDNTCPRVHNCTSGKHAVQYGNRDEEINRTKLAVTVWSEEQSLQGT